MDTLGKVKQMSRRKQSKPNRTGGWCGEVYWGGLDYNARLLSAYQDQIYQLALTRYEWLGLPATVDPLYLERVLLFKGCATIAQPKKGKVRGLWYAAKMVTDGELGIYDRPTKWIAYSRDKLRFKVNPSNGVVVYDNVNRTPLLNALDLCARELVDIRKTKQMNRFHQKVPYMLVVPPDMELSAVNMLNSIMSGEPATIVNKTVKEFEPYRLGIDVPFLGAELTAAEQNVWNQVYTLLGISNITFKSERMIEDEVRSMSEPASMMALSGLVERRRAADYLNDRFGLDVRVVWRADNESDNYNTLTNISDASKLISGQTKGLGEVLGNA